MILASMSPREPPRLGWRTSRSRPPLWRGHTRNRLGPVIKRAERIRPIGGFGIDRVAAAAEETGGRHGGPILRMENLDTDLPLPPEALEMTRTKLDDPRSNSWLPFTGDLDLRAAISDFTAELGAGIATTPSARSSSPRADWKRFLTSSSAPSIPETR
jgi:hypothetical protein